MKDKGIRVTKDDTVMLMKIGFAFKKVMKNEKVLREFLADILNVDIEYIGTS